MGSVRDRAQNTGCLGVLLSGRKGVQQPADSACRIQPGHSRSVVQCPRSAGSLRRLILGEAGQVDRKGGPTSTIRKILALKPCYVSGGADCTYWPAGRREVPAIRN